MWVWPGRWFMEGGVSRFLTMKAEADRERRAGCPSASNISVACWQRGDRSQDESSSHGAELIELIHILSQKAKGAPASSRRVHRSDAQVLPRACQVHLWPQELFTLLSLLVHADHCLRELAHLLTGAAVDLFHMAHINFLHILSPLLYGINLLVNLERLGYCMVVGFKWPYFSSTGTLAYNNNTSHLLWHFVPQVVSFYSPIFIQPYKPDLWTKHSYYGDFVATSLILLFWQGDFFNVLK